MAVAVGNRVARGRRCGRSVSRHRVGGPADRATPQRLILVLLVTIGCMLSVEGFLPHSVPALLPADAPAHVAAGIILGLAIGLVSSLPGVAGGELVIPTLVFAYGADIKTAGSATLLISIPAVTIGGARYARQGAFAVRHDLTRAIAPMGVGSVVGAVAGALRVPYASPGVLKVGLGFILILSALKMFHKSRGRVLPRPRGALRPSALHPPVAL